MPILIAFPVAIMLWLLAAWIGNDTACKAITTVNQPPIFEAIEWAMLACFIP